MNTYSTNHAISKFKGGRPEETANSRAVGHFPRSDGTKIGSLMDRQLTR